MALVATRHEVTGHTAEFPEETLPTWRALGWIPTTETETEPASSTKPAARKRAAEPEE